MPVTTEVCSSRDSACGAMVVVVGVPRGTVVTVVVEARVPPPHAVSERAASSGNTRAIVRTAITPPYQPSRGARRAAPHDAGAYQATRSGAPNAKNGPARGRPSTPNSTRSGLLAAHQQPDESEHRAGQHDPHADADAHAVDPRDVEVVDQR